MTFHRSLWRLMLVGGFVEVAAGKPRKGESPNCSWIMNWTYLNIVFGQSIIFSQEVTQQKVSNTTSAFEIRIVQILFMDKIRKTYRGGAVIRPPTVARFVTKSTSSEEGGGWVWLVRSPPSKGCFEKRRNLNLTWVTTWIQVVGIWYCNWNYWLRGVLFFDF